MYKRETKMFNPMTEHQFYSWMLDNLLFSTKKKLHDTEAIKFLLLIAHLEKSTFSQYWERNVNLSYLR